MNVLPEVANPVSEDQVNDSEWRYQLISEVIADYIFVLEVEPGGTLKLNWASDGLVFETGRKQGEILTLDTWKSIIHPDDLLLLLNFIQEMLSTIEKGNLECRSFHKDGHERWVRIFARQRKGPDGKATHIIGAVREITNQKHTEQQLKVSEQKYRKLHSSMTDAFCSVNMKGVLEEFNESFKSMLGYSEEELLKLTYFDLTPEKWHAVEARIVEEEILPCGASGIYEKEYIRKNGQVFPIEIRTFLVRDNSGEPSAMWAIVRDISERKLIENKLKAALEEKETLLREVHHRIKNNLQTVMTLIQMRSLEIVDETSLRVMTELQEQIRTISVIYQELFQSEMLSRVSMQPYIELLTSHLLSTFHYGNHIGLGVDCKDVVLDAKWAMPCGLIINELVTNALKYAFPPGFNCQPSIGVNLWKDGEGYSLQVSDNGIGLPDFVDIQNPATIGLHLVTLWAKHQMNGEMDLNRNHGSVITIKFKATTLR